MIVKALHVQNFRSILDERIDCDNLTVLVGRNGTGKSSFLRAMEMFYDPKATVTAEDFYAEDSAKEIEIAVTFADLGAEAKSLFAPYLESNELIVASGKEHLLIPREGDGAHGSIEMPCVRPKQRS